MIIREHIMGKTLKIEVDNEVIDVIKNKRILNLKYTLFLEKLWHDSLKNPLILDMVHHFEPYGKKRKLEKKKLTELMNKKEIKNF
ncbi:MAG: hypothetical protein ACFFA5_05930 [Promethearchaeota archaeon]